MRSIRSCIAIAIGAVMALAVACSGGGGSGGGTQNVTLTWWHNGTTDPLKSVWQQAADAYHGSHPNVSFKVQPIQNEQFPTKVPLALESNNPPDIYQQWGGGQEASQAQSNKVMDITQATSSWIKDLAGAEGWQVNGKQFGVPYDLHAVGFWYRKDLFAKAGVTTPPGTVDELNADIAKLKAAGIVPVAIGSKDRWPDAFYWDYFAVRECPTSTLKKAVKSVNMSDPCFTKAGQDLAAFLDTKPFQPGFLGTPAQQGAGSSAGMIATAKAAMELQGDWEPSVISSLTSDKNVSSQLGWFPFPAISGGAGDPAAALGGGDGFSCTSKATSACPDFLKYIDSVDVQTKLVTSGAASLPANPSAKSAITDPTVRGVLDYYQKASYIQTYFDIALPNNPGQALNDAVANFFAGQGSPASIPKSVTQ